MPGERKIVKRTISDRIVQTLAQIESERQVSIIFACESGSRAWGFESEDSDYDVRFIYLHPIAWYLSIDRSRDVIELPIDSSLDVSGWDLRKTLRLMRKSNPPLLEWLQSPIVYREHSASLGRLRSLIPSCYSPLACHYHYYHMAEGNYREYLRGDEVRLKKYFYVLRPLLACLWIERGFGVVPIEFSTLVDRLIDPSPLKQSIEQLVDRKRAGAELDKGPRIAAISDFLDQEIERLAGKAELPATHIPVSSLDRAFQEILTGLHGNTIEVVAGPDDV